MKKERKFGRKATHIQAKSVFFSGMYLGQADACAGKNNLRLKGANLSQGQRPSKLSQFPLPIVFAPLFEGFVQKFGLFGGKHSF